MKKILLSVQNNLLSEAIQNALVRKGRFCIENVSPNQDGEILDLCIAQRVDVLLMDVTRLANSTVEKRLELCEKIKEHLPNCKTALLCDEQSKNADELKKMPELDFSSPLSTAAFAMLVLLEYDESPENTIEMLNVLKGPQPMNGMDIQFLRDRIKGRGYIPRSYFEGSSVKNDYTPNVPYKITVSEYAYTYQSEGYAKVQVQSSGADSPRPIELRRKGNQWFLWRNLALSDIRTPASDDPWA